jgi:hypothetical protein
MNVVHYHTTLPVSIKLNTAANIYDRCQLQNGWIQWIFESALLGFTFSLFYTLFRKMLHFKRFYVSSKIYITTKFSFQFLSLANEKFTWLYACKILFHKIERHAGTVPVTFEVCAGKAVTSLRTKVLNLMWESSDKCRHKYKCSWPAPIFTFQYHMSILYTTFSHFCDFKLLSILCLF